MITLNQFCTQDESVSEKGSVNLQNHPGTPSNQMQKNCRIQALLECLLILKQTFHSRLNQYLMTVVLAKWMWRIPAHLTFHIVSYCYSSFTPKIPA